MSRQFEHLQVATLRRLQALIPHDCPLAVRRLGEPGTIIGGFVVTVSDRPDSLDGISGRVQVVAAWIDGYVTAWKRFDGRCECGTTMVCPDIGCDRHKMTPR